MSLYVRYQNKCSMYIDVNVGVECRFVVQLHTTLNHYMIHRHREPAYQVWYNTTTHFLFIYLIVV